MKPEKFLFVMGTGLLLSTGLVKAQDDFVKERPKELPKAEAAPVKPRPMPVYPNLEKGIDLFLLEWAAKTHQPLPKKGISITSEQGTQRYKLSLELGQARRFGAQAPQWFGEQAYTRQSGMKNELAVVFDPTGLTNEDVSQNLSETRTEVRTNGGFGESYTRNYERSYTSENGPRKKARKSLFSLKPEATLHLFSKPEQYRVAYEAAKAANRLVTNGTHEETDQVNAYFYLLVLEE